MVHSFVILCYTMLFLKKIDLFLGRGEEREKHQCVVASHVPPH